MSTTDLMVRVDDSAQDAALRDEIRRLRRELSDARAESATVRREAAASVAGLRRQLTPLYQALQAVFGELDTFASGESATTAAADPRQAAIWQQWKSRLGGQCAKVIDALLLQPDMNTTQLAIAIGTRRQNVPPLIYKMNQAGLINKNGGRFSLKAL